jgi:hypothetical protein
MEIKMNSLQSPIDDELKANLPKEVWDELLEYISQVQFMQNLIAPEETRGFIADREILEYESDEGTMVPYEDGRRVVDITNPHILQDMDYFRERALFFERNGRYTNLVPNHNPKSEYAEFWRGELRKWRDGLVRPDGEWIPGELYFYWNYSPIWLTERAGKSKKRTNRVRKFPRPWLGDYIFHHYIHAAKEKGMHGKLLKTRGVGFSFKAGAWSPRNMYVLPGSGNPNFHLASEKTFLSGDKGIWGKILDTLDWVGEHTPFSRMRLIDGKRAMEVQLGYEDAYGSRQGLLSSVYGISLKDNPDKARGIRGPFIHYEEDGLFPNLEKAWNVNRKAVEDGGVASGFMLAGGTGGVEGASFEGSEKLFYQHGAYNIFGIPNVFDRNTDGTTTCGFFWPAYLNRNLCYEVKNGEPDVIKATVEVLLDRYDVKYSASDALALTQKKAEEPMTPQEAVMRTEGTVFPVSDLKEYLEEVSVTKDSFLSKHYIGRLVLDPQNGSVYWKLDPDAVPLRSYEIVGGDKSGALEIFEMPRKNAEGQIASGRYIAGIDPIDSDTGQSLFSLLIMDTFTDRIVAEYSGRPRTAKEAYEICYRSLLFYNAQANYESNLKGLFSYFDQKNALHLLADVPQILKDMDFVKSTNLYGNKAKGTHANAGINSWGRLLQADWQRSRVTSPESEEDERLNLHTLRSFGYLQECIKWNSDGNFDRVSAGGMLFVLREDRFKRIQTAKSNQDKRQKKLSEDPFFKKNFRNGHLKGMDVFSDLGDVK